MFELSQYFPPEVAAFLMVIGIDLALAGDNAIVIGLAAAGLPKDQRNKAILLGVIAATVLRIIFALLTTQLLQIVGLLLAGGILLLWVCWKMWRELRTSHKEEHAAEEALEGADLNQDGSIAEGAPRKTFSQAAWQRRGAERGEGASGVVGHGSGDELFARRTRIYRKE